MSHCEDLKKSCIERNSAISNTRPALEKSFEHTDANVLNKSESNLRIKASMAQQLHSMGLKEEAICRLLRIDASKVAQWIRLQMDKEDVND